MFKKSPFRKVNQKSEKRNSQSPPSFALESLECRCVLSASPGTVSLDDGILSICGTDEANLIVVAQSVDQYFVSADFLSESMLFDRADVTALEISAGAGDDRVVTTSLTDLMVTIAGEAGADLIFGSQGDDEIDGGADADLIYGLAGNDRLLSGNGELDFVFGGAGDDVILLADGPNRAFGEDGDDIINGGNDADTIFGGAGNDSLSGSNGDDVILGASGNDRILGGNGNDVLHGIDGDDEIMGNLGDDTIISGQGNDFSTGGEGNDTIFGQRGNDRIDGNGGDDIILAGEGDDDVSGGVGDDNITGNADNDDIEGGEGADTITGDGGNDTIRGDSGDDSLIGGNGDDNLLGGDGNDQLVGGSGNDQLFGQAGIDRLFGDAGEDQLNGGGDADEMFGGPDADVLIGASGNDAIVGGGGNDSISGNEGDDLILGADGDDEIGGGLGNDIVSAGNGDDTVLGGDGNDILIGGAGVDSIRGEAGEDVLIGGSTDFDASPGQLAQIRSDWTNESATYEERVAALAARNLINGEAADSTDGAVSGDSVVDDLAGGADTDLFFAADGDTNDQNVGDGEIIANQIPVVENPILDQSVSAGSPLNFTIPTNTFADPEMEDITLSAVVSQPRDLQVSIENLAGTDGFSLTPFWVGLHDGSFDLFDVGSVATAGLELLAEDGDASTLESEFAAAGRVQLSGIGNSDGFAGAPVIEPGETAIGFVDITNPSVYPFMSFASMVIPSNDAFVGNENPEAYRVFNADGTFAGPITIEIFGSDIWDAGTEVNDTMGAAFSTVGGTATDEGGTVQAHAGLANFEGTDTPSGSTIAADSAPGADDLVARITISEAPDLPAWLSFDAMTGAFTGTPTNGDIGDVDLVVTATDPEGLKVTEEFTITVTEPNLAPVVDNPIADQSGAADFPVDFTLPADTFSDPNGDELTLSAEVAGPGGIEITIENLATAGGFSMTPLWAGLHNGSFDLFDNGVTATPGLELLAEEGDASELENEFSALGGIQVSGIGNAGGFGGAPVIEPGESASGVLRVASPSLYRFLSFASMVIPSNDAFIGNEIPSAYQIYNSDGTFAGPLTIEIFGSDIWDAGTEVNDTMGAAFSTIGGTATDENGMVHPHMGLSNFEGTNTPAGQIAADAAPEGTDLIARITINEAPALPSWLNFDSATGQFTGTPTAGDVGTIEVTVTATDPEGLSVSDAFDFTIEPANRAPVIVTPIPDQTATEGELFTYTIPDGSFEDPDMDALSFAAEVAERRDIQVEIENLADMDGFSLTPLWVGLHNGSFDLFDQGVIATNGLELLAEEGNASTLMTEFAASNRVQISGIANPSGFPSGPIIQPGESASGIVNIDSPEAHQFMSFASMVIPSNDAFIGNENPNSYRIFGGDGTFLGPITIEIYGADIWDAGTEVNNTQGAAFSAIPGTGIPEDGNVQPHPGLENFENTATPAGTIPVGAAPGADDLVARITITEVSTLPSWLTFDASTRTFTGTPSASDVGTLTLNVIATDDDDRDPRSVVDTFDIVIGSAP